MYNLLKLTIFTACLTMVIAVSTPSVLPFLGQRNFMDFMVKSRDISQRNPQRSLECFSYYTPILNDITAEYESNYAACLNNADDARSQADSKTKGDRNEIENSAKLACLALQSCTEYNSSIPYFTCYSDVGANNSKTMYGISANASSALANVIEQYRLITNDQYRCTNSSERAYVENTATIYDDLHNCLVYGIIAKPEDPETTESTVVTTESTTTSISTSTSPSASTETPTDSSTSTPTESTATTEEPIISTTVSDTTLSSGEPARLEIKNSKWADILAKMGRHFH